MAIYKFSNVGGFGTYQRYNNFLAGNPVFVASDFESIATVTLSGNQATVSFTSIPSTYQHLQIRAIARTDRAGTGDAVKMTVNSDTGSNYSAHQLFGIGSTTGAGAQTNAALIFIERFSGATATSGIFGAVVIDILDYKNTDKFTTVRAFGGVDLNGDGQIHLNTGLYRNTNAITSISFTPNVGTNFVQHSSFALYGIKG
jgi:hypothetical protein